MIFVAVLTSGQPVYVSISTLDADDRKDAVTREGLGVNSSAFSSFDIYISFN